MLITVYCIFILQQHTTVVNVDCKILFLQKHYGSPKEEDISIVLQIYKDLKIKKLYRNYEELTCTEIGDLVTTELKLGIR